MTVKLETNERGYLLMTPLGPANRFDWGAVLNENYGKRGSAEPLWLDKKGDKRDASQLMPGVPVVFGRARSALKWFGLVVQRSDGLPAVLELEEYDSAKLAMDAAAAWKPGGPAPDQNALRAPVPPPPAPDPKAEGWFDDPAPQAAPVPVQAQTQTPAPTPLALAAQIRDAMAALEYAVNVLRGMAEAGGAA